MKIINNMRNSIAMNQVKRYFFVTFCLFFSVFSVFAHTDQCVCKNYYDEELEAIIDEISRNTRADF